METKKPWLSKSVWTNVVMAGLAFIPSVRDWVASHSDVFVWGFSAINLVLRLVTKEKVSLND